MEQYTEEELKKICEDILKECEMIEEPNVNVEEIDNPKLKELYQYWNSNNNIEDEVEENISRNYFYEKISFDRVKSLYNNKEIMNVFNIFFGVLEDKNQIKLIDLGILPSLIENYKKESNALGVKYAIDSFKKNVLEEKIIDLLDIIKDDSRDIQTVWKELGKDGDAQNRNLANVIRHFKSEPDIMTCIWNCSDEKAQENNERLFPEIIEMVDNDSLPYIWLETSDKVKDNYANFFPDVINAVQDKSSHILSEIWEKTSDKVKEANVEIFPNVIAIAKDNLFLLEQIWRETSDIVKEANVEIFPDVIEVVKDYLSKLTEIWKNTSYNIQNANANTCQEVLKTIEDSYTLNNLFESTSPELQNSFFPILIERKSVEMIEKTWNVTQNNVQEKYIQQVINLVKGDKNSLAKIWNEIRSEDLQKKYIKQFINLVKDEDKSLAKIWSGIRSEDLQKKYIKQFINLVKDEDKSLAKIWSGIRSEKLQEKNVNILLDVMKKSSIISNVDVYSTWRNTSEKLQKRLLSRIIDECDYNKDIKKIWAATKKEVQNDKTDVLLKIMEKLKDDSSSITPKDIWWCTDENVRKNMLIPVLDILKNNSNYFYSIFRLTSEIESEIIRINFNSIYHIKTGKEITEKTSKLFNNLYKKNNNIYKTINLDFISKEEIINNYSEEELVRLTNYEETQDFIVKYYNNPLVIKSIDYLLQNDANWIISYNSIITDQYKFNCLLNNIPSDQEFNINDEIIQQFLTIISQRENYFEIMNYDDVKTFYGKKNEICLKILNGDLDNIPNILKEKYGNIDDLYKFALLEYKFEIDLYEAKRLVKKYGEDINELPDNNETEYLALLKDIINCECIQEIVKQAIDEDNLKQPWDGFPNARNAEGKIINMFEELYNKTLYNPKETDRFETQVYVDTIKNSNGEIIEKRKYEIPTYRIKDDFNLFIRVEGAYTAFKEPENFVEYYEKPDLSYHGNCTSYIGNDSIAPANTREGIAVGYGVIRKNSLINLGTKDLNSNPANREFSSYSYDNPSSSFRIPKNMIDNTRHTHNEMVCDRIIVDENKNVLRNRPDYAVWIEEYPEDRKVSINSKWEMTKKLAAQLGIPIVIIDREYFVKRESKKIEVMDALIKGEKLYGEEYEEYKKEYENLTKPELIREVITKFENNSIGIQFNKELSSKYFTQEQREKIINDIIASSKQCPTDERIECFATLERVSNKECWTSENSDIKDFYWQIQSSASKYKKAENIIDDNNSLDNQKKRNLLELYMQKGIEIQDVNAVKKELKYNMVKNKPKDNKDLEIRQ